MTNQKDSSGNFGNEKQTNRTEYNFKVKAAQMRNKYFDNHTICKATI